MFLFSLSRGCTRAITVAVTYGTVGKIVAFKYSRGEICDILQNVRRNVETKRKERKYARDGVFFRFI